MGGIYGDWISRLMPTLSAQFKNIVKGDALKTTEQYVDDARRDAFGALRVSEGKTQFDTQFQYRTFDGKCWLKKITGTGSITHLPNESSVRLNIGADSGDTLVWQSRRYIRYQPGKSQKILMTSVFGEQKAGVTKRFGYFDAENGIFLEQTGTSVNVVLRSFVSGAVVENRVAQAEWNVDRFDGTGASGFGLDSSKAQILLIDLEWLSVGRVRVGYVLNGVPYYCHNFNHANIIDSAYMTTANLPCRYEILNTADTASASNIKAICCSVQSESGFLENRYFGFSANSGITPTAVTTRRPVLSIRSKELFNGLVNRGDVNPLNAVVTASTNSCLVEVVTYGTLTGASWVSVNDDSIVEYDISATAISGGRVVQSFFVTAGAGQTRGQTIDDLKSRITLALDIDGNSDVAMSIVVTSISGTSNVLNTLSWRETY